MAEEPKPETPETPEIPKTPEEKEEPQSDLEKIKAHNAEMDKELLKAREGAAELKKIEAEKVLGGETGGAVESKPKDPAQDMADEISGAFT